MEVEAKSIKADKAMYIGFESAFASLEPSCSVGLRSVVEIKNHLQSKQGTSIKQTKTGENDVFMGIIERTLELNPSTNSFRLDLTEISSTGVVGESFFLTLYKDISKAWSDNSVIKLYNSKMGVTLVVLRGNGIMVSIKGGCIHFDLTSAVKCKATIWTKQYFSSVLEAKADNYVYTDLSKASKEVNKIHNMFVVVQDVLKAPARTAKGTYHGMVSVVDPTCYDGNLHKTADFVLHMFIPNLENYPTNIKRGDILRVHRCKADLKPNVDKLDFYIFREHDLLIFPAGDHLNPLSKSQRFTMTAQELDDVKRLNAWSFSRYQERAMPPPSPPPAAPSAEPPLRTIEEIKAGEDFSLPCRLVKACQSSKEWSLWVEDGTKCTLLTSNCEDELEAYDSQKTLNVGHSNSVIQVRAPLKMIEDLLAQNGKALENSALLFLRHVKGVPGIYPDVDSTETVAVFFDVVGDVEVLPKNTRYYNVLTKRLNSKAKQQPPVALQVLPVEPGPSTQQPVAHQTPDILPEQTHNPSPVTSLKEKTPVPVKNSDAEPAVVCGLSQSFTHIQETEPVKTRSKSVVSLASSTTSSKQVASSSSSTTSSKRMTRLQSEPQSPKTRSSKQQLLSTPEKRHDDPSPKFQTPPEHQSPPRVRTSSKKFTCTRYDTVSSQSSSEAIIVQPSPSVDNPIDVTPEIIDEISDASNRPSSTKKKTKHNSGNGHDVISSSMESTEKAMVEIPSSVFNDTEWVPKTPYKTVMKDAKKELRRMHLYAHPEADLSTEEESEDSEMEGPQPARLMESQDISFAEPVVTSTQKPRETHIVPETIEEDEESQSYPEAQPIVFSSPEVGKNDTSLSSNDSEFERSSSSSPHPKFRAIEEVLEIRTNCSQSTAGDDFRSIPTDSPLVHSQSAQDDLLVNEEMVVESSVVRRIQHRENKVESPQQQRVAEVIKRKAESPAAPATSKKKKRNASSSSDSSITDVMSDSDESIIELVPSSQLDLEHQYRLVEESITVPDPFVMTMTEVEAIQPGGRFRISTSIKSMTSVNQQTSRQTDLENLLVATCFECNHIWQYHHFKNSISERVKRQRRISSSDNDYEDDETHGGAYNYLCSEEIHARNMTKLVETGDSKGLEYDVLDCFIDRSFVFVCPECKSFKKPDCLIQLVPSFFFRLHANSLQDESKCLHILATGVHAEYFLGTRADYVLRNAEVWERCQRRLNQLLSCDKPLTLSLRRSADQPKEIYLENTKVVFSETHVLPWWD